MGHRVAPDPLVDRFPVENLAFVLGKQLDQFELATGQVEALTTDESLELVGPDLDLADNQRSDLLIAGMAATASDDRLDVGDHFFRMAGLVDPVVGPDPQATNPLRNRRAVGTDDHSEIRHQAADLLQVFPATLTDHIRVEKDGIDLHRDELLRRNAGGKNAVLPTGRIHPV